MMYLFYDNIDLSLTADPMLVLLAVKYNGMLLRESFALTTDSEVFYIRG